MDKRYNNVTSVKKESPEKHVKQGNPHLHAVDLEKKQQKKPVADTHNQELVSSSPVGRRLAKMAEKDKL